MEQAQHAAPDKKFWPMHVVKFVVIYCVCVWSTVCFSCTEAKPIPHQRQSNMNGTTGNSIGIITSTTAIIGAITAIIVAIGVIVGIAKCFQRPKISHHPESTKVIAAGQTAELRCEASGKPAPNFQWLKDDCDEALADSDDVTMKTGNGHSTLTINNIQKSDAGRYKCKASSLFSCWEDISNNAIITVAGPPTITQHPGAAKVKSGSEASFTCAASSDLIPAMSIASSDLSPMEFSWQKDSSIITSSSVTVHKSGNMYSSTLTLKHVSTTDAGSYTCTASNDAGSVTSNDATLQVTDPLSVYVDRLKQVYRAPPPTWNRLPKCGHIKLAMIREKGMRRGEADETMVRHQVKGEVEAIVASRVPIEVDRIFDSGHQVILVEGPPGGGKTSLTYYYSQEWAAGNLSMFDVVAVVHLHTLDATKTITLPDLLLLACASGNDEGITRDMIQQYVLECPRLLLVLDGWDEAPNELRKPSFITKILQSIMPQSKILITSRPESSVDLHGLANRVEIVGFTEESIDEYFQRALCMSTELDHDKVEDGCQKLKEHFRNHPVIQSCCSIPLNAAILAHLFLTDHCLPSTRHELFLMLVLSRINKELQGRHSQRNVTVLSLDDLPHEHKTALSHICVLAFEGVKQNKVVFPQEELVRLKLPLDLPALGLLQIVECYGRLGQTSYRYFIHLSIQELLAAYHISQLREDEQVKVFQDLLDEPRFSSVLQFYAAFTRFTNQGVQDIVTGIDLANKKRILFTIMRCCFEANSQDQLLYQEIIQRLNGRLWIFGVALTPFDCMSVGYFLVFALRTGELLDVTFPFCGIDDHSLGLLLGELSRHAEACPSGNVLQGVKKLDISFNNVGDDSMARLATALQANTTMKILDIDGNLGITVNGAKSLGRALSVNSSLEGLNISSTSIGDEGIAHIATALQTNTTMKGLDVSDCGMSCKGAESLASALTPSSSLEKLNVRDNILGDDGLAHIATALKTNNTLNSLVYCDGTATDKAALSLAAALTTNTSMEYIHMGWSSTHPDTTLKKVAEYVRKSTLRKLELHMFRPSVEPRMSEKEVIEWLRQLEVGGKEFILSLKDSQLEWFSLELIILESSVEDLKSRVYKPLDGAATSVNTARKINNLPEIEIIVK